MAEAENRLERIREELFGIIILFLSVFLFITLVSYRADDPSFFTSGGNGIHNYGGLLGSYLSALLFQSLGLGSFAIFVLCFFAAGFKLFRRENLIWGRSRLWLGLRALGLGLILVCFSALVSLISTELNWSGEAVKSGGWIGFLLGKALSNLVSTAPAFGFCGLGILAGVVLGFNISALKVMGALYEYGESGFYRMVDFSRQRISKWRRKQEVEEQRKLLPQRSGDQGLKITEPTPVPEEAKTNVLSMPESPKQERLSFMPGSYVVPSLKLLDGVPKSNHEVDRDSLLLRARLLEKKLLDFGVAGQVEEVQPGPVITMYEFKPAPGVKINRVANLADDLACALSAVSVRIIAPLPGKGVVGIEIPNQERETVYFKELIASSAYQNSKSLLTLTLGKNIFGEPFVIDLRKAPHLLVAGATGSGKSVSLNAMIMSVLFRSTPEQVRMLMIDPKRLEFSMYEGIPHLLSSVISEPKEASVALKWAVMEMETRYATLAQYGARNIDSYNRLVEEGKKTHKRGKRRRRQDGSTLVLDKIPEKYPSEQMPLILLVIDELADLMMVASRDCETSITRLAQMARAAGIHLIVATQRPSVDVITGLIKANFSARISFQVASKIDSRTILDQQGSERLLGMGDLLFMAPGTSHLVRVHGAYVSEAEIKRVVSFWKKQGQPQYNDEILKAVPEDEAGVNPSEMDDLYEQAVELVVRTRQASVSMLQRKLRIGYNRSARMIEQMEQEGIIGISDGVKPREVIWDQLRLETRLASRMKGAG